MLFIYCCIKFHVVRSIEGLNLVPRQKYVDGVTPTSLLLFKLQGDCPFHSHFLLIITRRQE